MATLDLDKTYILKLNESEILTLGCCFSYIKQYRKEIESHPLGIDFDVVNNIDDLIAEEFAEY